MTQAEILDKLKEMVSEQLRIEKDKINLDTDIYKGLGADSLDLVELLMNVEAEWDIIVDDSEVADLHLISDVVELIIKKTK